MTPQNTSSVGSIARMSRPIIRKHITGAIAAIIRFMLMNSSRKLLRTFSGYVPPIMSFMNSDWKMKRPKANPARYSTMRSIHIGRPRLAVITAATMMPVASPATQWIVDPTPCRHNGLMKFSCSPGRGSLSAIT